MTRAAQIAQQVAEDLVARKERPILFTTEMVKAILERRKTMTRRVVKPQPEFLQIYDYKGKRLLDSSERKWCSKGIVHGRYPDEYIPSLLALCPYQVGMRLWVRETWMADGADCREGMMARGEISPDVLYRAEPAHAKQIGTMWKWKPSIFMPRWASRITLEITEIRVERVQSISAEDARAEGVIVPRCDCERCSQTSAICPADASAYIDGYRELWDSINSKPKPVYARVNGKRVIAYFVSHPWEVVRETRTHQGKAWYVEGNPWVWVIGFKRVTTS